jgi:hypothetical protein
LTSDLPQGVALYFVDAPLDTEVFDHTIEPDSPLEVDVLVPLLDGLKSVFVIEVVDRADGYVVRGDPVFVTVIGERVVLTDVPFELLRDETRNLLMTYVETGNTVSRLSLILGWDEDEAASRLAAAVEELGASSLEEAAVFIAEGMNFAGGVLSPIM